MEVFKKVSIDFDYQQLRKDVEDTYNAIKLNAVGTVYEGISGRNQCITVSKENSDEWYDGIAGKSMMTNSREGNPITAVQDDSNEILDETRFIHPIKQIQGTYLEQFVNGFSDVFRWRISVLPPRTTLSIHKDGSPMMSTFNNMSAILDWRLHFPITTNNRCFLVNWPDNFMGVNEIGEQVSVEMAHFKAGRSYLLNTSKTHCATNYSATERIHLIASVGKIEQFTQAS
tara:strand:+ start:435 stop:1121 length:687 start_codon:yes stop_codon:yes gene_type:complete